MNYCFNLNHWLQLCLKIFGLLFCFFATKHFIIAFLRSIVISPFLIGLLHWNILLWTSLVIFHTFVNIYAVCFETRVAICIFCLLFVFGTSVASLSNVFFFLFLEPVWWWWPFCGQRCWRIDGPLTEPQFAIFPKMQPLPQNTRSKTAHRRELWNLLKPIFVDSLTSWSNWCWIRL